MAFDINNPYFRTKVLTASPEQLRLMLIDGGIHFATLGRDAMHNKDWEGVYENLSQAKAILVEMMSGLKPEVAPELCSNLSSLYTFMVNELTQASFNKEPQRVDKVIELMEYDKQTWILLMEKLATDKGDTPQPNQPQALPNTPSAVKVAPNPAGYNAPAQQTGARKPLSLQG